MTKTSQKTVQIYMHCNSNVMNVQKAYESELKENQSQIESYCGTESQEEDVYME